MPEGSPDSPSQPQQQQQQQQQQAETRPTGIDFDLSSPEELLLLESLHHAAPATNSQPQPQQLQQQDQSCNMSCFEPRSSWSDCPLEVTAAAAAAADARCCTPSVWRHGSGSTYGGNSYSDLQRLASAASATWAQQQQQQQQQQAISPDGDVMYFFRRIFSMPPFPGGLTLGAFVLCYFLQARYAAFSCNICDCGPLLRTAHECLPATTHVSLCVLQVLRA
jgi:hypothetical protein